MKDQTQQRQNLMIEYAKKEELPCGVSGATSVELYRINTLYKLL